MDEMYHSISNYLALMRDPAMAASCWFCFNEEVDVVGVHIITGSFSGFSELHMSTVIQ